MPVLGLLALFLFTDAGSTNWSVVCLLILVGEFITFVRGRLRERSGILAFSRAGVALSVRDYPIENLSGGPAVLIVLTGEKNDLVFVAPSDVAPIVDAFPTIYLSPGSRRVRGVKFDRQWHEAREVPR